MNPESTDVLRSGSYAKKQIFCRSRVVAWSHGSRFDLARALVRGRGGRLLDYGCGDGTFIAMVHRDFSEATGVDVDAVQTADCARRLGNLPNVRFGLTGTLPLSADWDVVTCMEVLEHCLEHERRRVLDQLAGLVAPTGMIVISVPIEIGPSLLGKQVFRALAGFRRLGDYQHRERYTPFELARAVAGARLGRPTYEGVGSNGQYRYYGHKGFDFRELQAEIAERLTIVRRLFTPLAWLGPMLNSQVWFVCSRQG
ncbi:MAG TPA: methyltransferase domain-containing protein [Vicinamibacterales bacterium]